MTRVLRSAVVAVGVVVLGTLCACGVPIDQSPAVLSKAAIPFHLLAPASHRRQANPISAHSKIPVSVFFLSESGRLVPTPRVVPSGQTPAVTVTSALDLLIEGPTAEEAAEGLQSAIPPQTTVLGVTITGTVATVDVGGTFGQLVGVAQVQAVAQVVFTVVAVPGDNVTGVSFELAGQPVEVPVESGSEVPVVNPSDFTLLAPVPFPHSASP